MKALDRNIQKVIIPLLITILCGIAIVDIELAKNIIVLILLFAYFMFFASHLFLFMPFIFLMMMVSEYMQNTNFYNKTKAESDILGWLTIAIPFVVAVFIIYWLIPALTYTLYLETFDVCKGNRAI